MQKSFRITFGLFLLGMLLLVSGCQMSKHVQTAYPLEEDELTRLLEQVGLPGTISEDETVSRQEGHISYVIRNPAETYGNSGNNKLVANVTSLVRKDGRVLSTIFHQSVAGEPIVWADWERQIKLAALLYGGFEDEGTLYKACTEAELPTDTTSFRWETDFPEGYYCVVYRSHKNKAYDERSFEVVTCSATLWVDIYESRELYDKMKADSQ